MSDKESDIRRLTEDLHSLDKQIGLLAEMQKLTTNNVEKLASSVAKTFELLPEIKHLQVTMNALHIRLDRVEVDNSNLDVYKAKVDMVSKIVFSVLAVISLGVLGKLLLSIGIQT